MNYKKKPVFIVCTIFILSVCFTIFLSSFNIDGVYAYNSNLSSEDTGITNNDTSSGFVSQNYKPATPFGLIKPEVTGRINNEIVKTIDSNNVENIKINAENCTLILEKAEGNTFEACFSYSNLLASKYDNFFNLRMEYENKNTVVISTDYIDWVFEEADSSNTAILVVKIPEKNYTNVGLNLSVFNDQTIDFNVKTSSLEITSKVGNITFKAENIFDNLQIEHRTGDFNLVLNELSKNMDISIEIGTFTLMLPDNPKNISLTIDNINSEAYLFPEYWNLSINKNTVIYDKGTKSNKINLHNKKLGAFNVEVRNTNNVLSANISNTTGKAASKEYYTDISLTSYAKRDHFEINESGNYFTWGRVDVVDNNGYDHQAIVIVCNGSDSFTKKYRNFLLSLEAAYPDDYGYIVGYLDINNDPRTYREVSINFFDIQNVTYTDNKGIKRNAVVIAFDGSEDFIKKYSEYYSSFYDAYIKRW